MKCQECRGACCEVFEVPLIDLRPQSEDAFQWIMHHGRTVYDDTFRLQFECRCTKLSEQGRCSIYASRPQVCRDMSVGGAECLDYVRHRRTPAEYALIREAHDPQTLHRKEA